MTADIDAVGVVGIGTIGRKFVAHLTDSGYETVVFDVDPDPVADAVDAGASAAESSADVARRTSVTLLSLPGREYVEQAMEGEDGVLAGLGEGDVVVDTGTTPPDVDVHYANRCGELGAGYVDAPLTLSGPGEPGDGPMINMFVGGRPEDYERVREVIEAVSHDHRRYGGVGVGHVVKAGHRMYQNCTKQVVMEFAEYLYNNGVEPDAFDDHMGVGIDDRIEREVYPSARGFHGALAGETTVADERGYRVDESGARPRLRTSNWAKDPAYAVAIAHASNTYMPLLTTAYQTQLAAQNYAEALFDRKLVFQDEEFFDRADTAAVYRLLNRPSEEWRRASESPEE